MAGAWYLAVYIAIVFGDLHPGAQSLGVRLPRGTFSHVKRLY
jgi:hypothetical protein